MNTTQERCTTLIVDHLSKNTSDQPPVDEEDKSHQFYFVWAVWCILLYRCDCGTATIGSLHQHSIYVCLYQTPHPLTWPISDPNHIDHGRPLFSGKIWASTQANYNRQKWLTILPGTNLTIIHQFNYNWLKSCGLVIKIPNLCTASSGFLSQRSQRWWQGGHLAKIHSCARSVNQRANYMIPHRE